MFSHAFGGEGSFGVAVVGGVDFFFFGVVEGDADGGAGDSEVEVLEASANNMRLIRWNSNQQTFLFTIGYRVRVGCVALN